MFKLCRIFNTSGNYMRMFSYDPFHYHFAYLDDVKLWSKEIFNENGTCVKIRRTKNLRSNKDLKMVFASVKTADQLKFIRCMRELKTQMILAGSKDYLDICNDFKQKCIMRT